MVQIEDVLQLGSQITVQIGQKTENAEQRRDDDEWDGVIRRAGRRRFGLCRHFRFPRFLLKIAGAPLYDTR
jgi:hypothetical protein